MNVAKSLVIKEAVLVIVTKGNKSWMTENAQHDNRYKTYSFQTYCRGEVDNSVFQILFSSQRPKSATMNRYAHQGVQSAKRKAGPY